MDEVFVGPDGKPRCVWCRGEEMFLPYHDSEWGFPVADDRRLFEKLCLEGFQSGLSWRTILMKRENFRAAFEGFDCAKVARFGEPDVARLLADAGIVRHRGKIEATINNARRLEDLLGEFGSLAAYVWRWEPEAASRPTYLTHKLLATMTTSPQAIAMSKDLKKRGWSFVGPTTVYAFHQAMGLVNDHIEGCFVRPQAGEARLRFTAPKGKA
jgi:DNA-3-methyladenine glycosylase I